MNASADNTFIGASVTDKNGDKFLVVKVNAKSMYVAKGWTLEQYNTAFNMKPKGTTFKAFCEKNNIEMVKYSDYEIEDTEAAKKEVVEESKKASNATSALGQAEKLVLTNLLKYKQLHRLQNIQVGDTTMRVLENKDNNRFLLNVDKNYVLYNKDLDITCNVCSVFDYGTKVKEIPWEKITPKEVAKAVVK